MAQKECYTIRRPGHVTHEFEASKDAIKFVVEHSGPSLLYGPNGLILTKGVLTPRDQQSLKRKSPWISADPRALSGRDLPGYWSPRGEQ